MGRIVWLYLSTSVNPSGDGFAAIVTGVNGDGTVDLVGFDQRSINFLEDVPHGPASPTVQAHWAWPPRTPIGGGL